LLGPGPSWRTIRSGIPRLLSGRASLSRPAHGQTSAVRQHGAFAAVTSACSDRTPASGRQAGRMADGRKNRLTQGNPARRAKKSKTDGQAHTGIQHVGQRCRGRIALLQMPHCTMVSRGSSGTPEGIIAPRVPVCLPAVRPPDRLCTRLSICLGRPGGLRCIASPFLSVSGQHWNRFLCMAANQRSECPFGACREWTKYFLFIPALVGRAASTCCEEYQLLPALLK
jgi:hypothetical protein